MLSSSTLGGQSMQQTQGPAIPPYLIVRAGIFLMHHVARDQRSAADIAQSFELSPHTVTSIPFYTSACRDTLLIVYPSRGTSAGLPRIPV